MRFARLGGRQTQQGEHHHFDYILCTIPFVVTVALHANGCTRAGSKTRELANAPGTSGHGPGCSEPIIRLESGVPMPISNLLQEGPGYGDHTQIVALHFGNGAEASQ